MTFYTTRGDDKLVLSNGTANLIMGGEEFPVCAADVTCSSFSMSEEAPCQSIDFVLRVEFGFSA